MKVWGIDRTQLSDALGLVNADYDGNLRIENYREQGTRVVTLNFVLRVKSSRDKGARRSGSGRRTIAACWHAHRDVYLALFEKNPNARIQTSLADYRGAVNFEEKYRSTAGTNVGSMIRPARIAESCECGGGFGGPERGRMTSPALFLIDGDEVLASTQAAQEAIAEWDAFIEDLQRNQKPRMVRR